MLKQIGSGAFALVLLAWSVSGSAAATESAFPPLLTSKLDTLYATAYGETIGRHLQTQRDGTTYVTTGDIRAEWLRDASAIVRPFIGLSRRDADIAKSLRGVVERQARYILIDPYANAFTEHYKVVEEKFEVDSLLYPIWFASDYYRQTRDASIFTPEVRKAFKRVLHVLHVEQHHDTRSHLSLIHISEPTRQAEISYAVFCLKK